MTFGTTLVRYLKSKFFDVVLGGSSASSGSEFMRIRDDSGTDDSRKEALGKSVV